MNMLMPKWQSIALMACVIAGCGGGGGYGGGNGGNGGGTPTYTIGGTVSGLNGTVVLQNNGRDDVTVTNAGGAGATTFTFVTAVTGGGPFAVTVKTHPLNQSCAVSGGAGTAAANIANVAIACTALPQTTLRADASVRSATLHWDTAAGTPGVASFNIRVEAQCVAGAACPAPQLLVGVTSPLTVSDLVNGQPYLFSVESIHVNSAHGLSNTAAARPNALAFNNEVAAIASDANGNRYLGGSFTEVGIASGIAVPVDATTGRLANANFPIVLGRKVYAVVADGNGGWYLGGDFVSVGDQPFQNLAHVRADGTVDPTYAPRPDQPVRALVLANGILYAGGHFTQIGPVGNRLPRSHLASLEANGRVTGWGPVADDVVLALAAAGNTIYVGGQFTTIDNKARQGVAAIDATGVVSEAWKPLIAGVNGTVPALAVADGTVYFAADFTVGANHAHVLAAVDAADSTLHRWNVLADDEVRALAVTGDTVYAGGNFTAIDNTPRARLAAFSTAGVLLNTWKPEADDIVKSIAVSGSTIYIAGYFTQLNGEPHKGAAAIATNGQALFWGPALNNNARCIAVSGGIAYVGGAFTGTGSVTRNRLAAVDPAGRLLDWNPDADGPVNALLVRHDTVDKVLVGGEFAGIGPAPNSTPRHLLAEISVGGELTAWNPSSVPIAGSSVHALALSGTTLYAGGNFDEINGEAHKNLVAIDADTGTLLPWDVGASSTVRAVEVVGDTVYVGGQFTSIEINGGTQAKPRNRVAAIGGIGDGTVFDTWSPSIEDGAVVSLAVANDVVYVGGTFVQVVGQNGTPKERHQLAAFSAHGANNEGELLVLWNPNIDNDVEDVEIRALEAVGQSIYVGGFFQAVTMNGARTLRRNAAAIGADGKLLPWDPNADSAVTALEVSSNTVGLGGFFTTLHGSPRTAFGVVEAGGAGELVP